MKRILSTILAFSFIFSLCIFNVDAQTHWAQDVADTLLSQGIISGDENGDLNLDGEITRAEFAKIINKSRKLTSKADANFPDVKEDKWYFEEMLIAKGNGYMTGDENGNANPENNITRAEASVILARISGLDTSDLSSSIVDIDEIPDWAKGAVIALNKKGIIKGYEDGSFKPFTTLKRGESFSLISNLNLTNEEENKETENDPISAPPLSVNTNVSTGGGSGGGGSSSGGGSNIIVPLPTIAETPSLKYNASNGYLLSWNNCYGASSYIVKIKISGEAETEIPLSQNSIDLYSHFINYASLRDNASEDFLVSVKSVGITGYSDSSYSSELKIKADFESISSPTITARYGIAGGVGRAIITWSEVPAATDYTVNLSVDGNEKQDGFTVDKLNKEIIIPDTSFITDNTVLSVVAISSDPMYKNSAPAEKRLVIEKEQTVEQDGSAEKPWLISTADEFYKIGTDGSKYLKTDYYVITNDFIVTKPLVMPDNSAFEGNIEGKLNGSKFKPTITLNIGSESSPYKGSTYAGLIADLKGIVSNLNINGKIYADVDGVGAICGNLTGTVTACVNNALISNEKNKTGGIAGNTSGATVSNCVNNGVISGSQYVAGIAGYTASTKINGCYNTASGKITATNTYAAGISGYAQASGSSISKCANYGHITTVKGYTSGILSAVMATSPITISECFNAGIIEGTGAYMGSIVALARNGDSSKQTIDCSITDCFNVWQDDANNNPLGLVGYIKYKNKATDSTTDVGFERTYSTNDLPLYGKSEDYIKDAIEAINLITADDCYYVGTEDTDRRDTALTNSDTLKSLLTDYPAFNSNNLWFISDGSDGYYYPQLINNPYKKESIIIPKVTNVIATKDGENLKFTWTLPENVSNVSIKVNNNTRIETVTDGYVELSDDLTVYTLNSFTDNSYYEIFVKMEFNDGSEFTDNKEIYVNSDN